MESDSQIEINPNVCNGKPVIRGTRTTVQTVLEFLAAGDSVADVLGEFNDLKKENIYACIDYASKLMGNHYTLKPIQ